MISKSNNDNETPNQMHDISHYIETWGMYFCQ